MNQAPRRRCAGERGETLLETLATVTILGITVVAVMFGLATAINLSRDHQDDADAAIVLTAAADAVKDATYVACPGVSTASYDPTVLIPAAGIGLPTHWSTGNVAVTNVQAWNGSGFGACAATDRGMQLVTVAATSPDGKTAVHVDVVKRAPT